MPRILLLDEGAVPPDEGGAALFSFLGVRGIMRTGGKARLTKKKAKPEETGLTTTTSGLSENQQKAAELWALGKADGTAVKSKSELADLLGLAQPSISAYFKSEKFMAEVDRLLKESTRENKRAMTRYVPEAIDALVRDMRGAPSARDRITAARAILEMAGMNDKTVNVNVNGEIGVVRGGFGKDALAAAADIIDTEYTILSNDDPDEVSPDAIV